MRAIGVLAAGVLAVAGPAAAQSMQMTGKDGSTQSIQQPGDPDEPMLEQAIDAIHAKRPAAAIPLLDRVIADEEVRYAGEKRMIFCARSTEEAILYAGMAATQKKDALILGKTWALATFLKGFALIDMGSEDAAKPLLERAVALSPMNAQFLAELGEWHKNRHEWDAAFSTFQSAASAAEFTSDDQKSFEKRRALRGMGFALTEQGKYDEAEKLYRQCLKLDANDEKAKSELEYIREQRAKPRTPTS